MSAWVRQSAVPGVGPPPSPSWLNTTGSATSPMRSILESSHEDQNVCSRTSVRILQGSRLNLIHIPLRLYGHFVQAILALVLPELQGKRNGRVSGRGEAGDVDSNDIINISVTSVECSIVCSTEKVERWFRPLVENLREEDRETVEISEEEFVAIQVDGDSLDAGQRVLDLTSPLATAGISIFFISTYFADYILVPSKSTTAVITALQHRGFVFEKDSDTYSASHRRSSSSSQSLVSSDTTYSSPPLTPSELECRTFDLLRTSAITPQFNPSQRLILVGERRNTRKSAATDSFTLSLTRLLTFQPEFISVTLTDGEPTSILLEVEQLDGFKPDGDLLYGSKKNLLVPITLDLRGLPLESTGIVCGVAGRLVGGTRGMLGEGEESVEMTYLSTARAGTVMVAESDLERAVVALSL